MVETIQTARNVHLHIIEFLYWKKMKEKRTNQNTEHRKRNTSVNINIVEETYILILTINSPLKIKVEVYPFIMLIYHNLRFSL